MLNNENLLWCTIKLLKIQMVNVSMIKDLNICYIPSTFVFFSQVTKILSFSYPWLYQISERSTFEE